MPTLKNIIELMINPFFLSVVLLMMCLIIAWRRSESKSLRGGLLLILICLLMVSTGWLPRYLTASLESQYPAVLKADQRIQWIVVLSGGESSIKDMPENARLYTASIKRLVEGVRLYRLLPDSRLLLSGGGYGHDEPEATLMAQLATWFKIPKEKLVLETQSLNTQEQAKNIYKLIGDKPFYLVTSAIHMPRSMSLFNQLGMHPIAAPTDYTFVWSDERWGKIIIPNTYNSFYFTVAMHELLGRGWSKWH